MYDLSTNTISQSQVLTRNQSSENVEFNSSVIDIDCLRNTDLTLKCAIAESETEQQVITLKFEKEKLSIVKEEKFNIYSSYTALSIKVLNSHIAVYSKDLDSGSFKVLLYQTDNLKEVFYSIFDKHIEMSLFNLQDLIQWSYESKPSNNRSEGLIIAPTYKQVGLIGLWNLSSFALTIKGSRFKNLEDYLNQLVFIVNPDEKLMTEFLLQKLFDHPRYLMEIAFVAILTLILFIGLFFISRSSLKKSSQMRKLGQTDDEYDIAEDGEGPPEGSLLSRNEEETIESED